MYQALYRKWRPQSFADVIGQSAITDTLTKQVENGKYMRMALILKLLKEAGTL